MLSLFEFNKIWVFIYLLLVLGISLEGSTRKIGWLWAAIFSLLLTPIIGGLITLLSPKRTSPNPKSSGDLTYTCQSCGFGFTEPRDKCSICGQAFPGGSDKGLKKVKKTNLDKATSV